MITSINSSPLYKIVNPQSSAFFGASNNFSRMGSIMLSSVQALGYEGAIYPIHPSEKTVRGYKAFKSVMDLPEPADLAVMVLPTDIVTDAMRQCGERGIKHAIVVSGGFKESGSAGAELQKELEAVADNYGIRFLGPNCLGVANPHLKLNPTPIPAEGPPGFVGLASQSGSFITQMFNYLYRHGMGFSTALSVGNEANIDIVDCMEYLGVCPHTRVISLYIEGINRGREFIETAKAITPHKPIVALYVGGSEAGKKAGMSHTGSMAGPDEVYDGMFRQCGVMRAKTLSELFDFSFALASLPKPSGKRVIIQTNSGGPGAAAADSIGRAGFELPILSQSTIEKLRKVIPRTASTDNPVDMTFSKSPMDDFYEIPNILLQEENADMLLIYFISPAVFFERVLADSGLSADRMAEESKKFYDTHAHAFFSLVQKYKKPVIGYTYRSLQEPIVRDLLDRGVPIYKDPERAARAMAALVEYHTIKDKVSEKRISGRIIFEEAGSEKRASAL
ncbi:MAG: CoA-binding protein [Syntrophales bacterium]|jgi:acyl-CoA synthetase (NDP forming)|nr:CoA-binding protein [Syntrophales bacterium]